jgi:phage terminase large subunit-like protein
VTQTKTRARTASASSTRRSSRSSAPLEPNTVEHFRAYCALLVLDNGEPFLLEDWQQDFAADFFSGTKQSWLIVPEGNGKTTFLAALALYHADYTPDAAGVIAAAAREQAELMYVQARGFVDRTPGMSDRFRCFDGYRRIKSRRLRGVVQVKAADDRTGDGIIPTLCLIDELHRHRDLALLRTWIGKLRKRKGQLVVISTAGEPAPSLRTPATGSRRLLVRSRRAVTGALPVLLART